jgi:hypothetical protein
MRRSGLNLLRTGKSSFAAEAAAPIPTVEEIMSAKTGEFVKRMNPTGLNPETVPGTSAVPFAMILPTDAQDAAGDPAERTIDFELTPRLWAGDLVARRTDLADGVLDRLVHNARPQVDKARKMIC